MDISTWFRTWGKEQGVARSGSLMRAVAAGAETRAVLQLAAQELCAAALADRTGIWFLGEEDGRMLEGVVVEKGSKPALQEWQTLDRSMPFLEMLLSSGEPVVVDLHKVPQAASLGPLARMRTAAWIPLRIGGVPLGLVLVAYSISQLRVAPETLQERADELAIIVSERQSRAALHRLRAECHTLVESLEQGTLVLDLSGRVRFANASFVSLVGLDTGPDRSLAMRLGTLEAIADSLEGNLVWADAFPAQPARESFIRRWRDPRSRAEQTEWDALELLRPEHRLLERRVWPVKDADGRTVGWLEIFRDVTGQRKAHARMQQTEKLAALGQLVSGIAHELSNPLTSILGYAQLLLGVRSSAQRQADLRRVYREAERARGIVNNLLLFARGAPPERRSIDLNEIAERTVALRGYELAVQDIQLDTDLAPNLPKVSADANQIQQVLLNLLVNAEQAILQVHPPEAAGRPRGHIRVSTRTQGDSLALEVADDGPGIPAELEQRIFDPFFTTKPMGQGTGLGLSIAYGIVREHGGRISVRRGSPGEFRSGAAFTVELPIPAAAAVNATEVSDERPRPTVVPRPNRKGGVGFRARVLVVEDEPTVAQLVADVLREEGHQVETVTDGREGLAHAMRNSYDLLICDLRMPRLDGRSLYEELIRSGAGQNLRIIFITGDTLGPRTLDFLTNNDLPYLAKPFLVEELKAAVNRVLVGPGEEAPGVRPLRGPAIANARKNPGSPLPDSRPEVVRKK